MARDELGETWCHRSWGESSGPGVGVGRGQGQTTRSILLAVPSAVGHFRRCLTSLSLFAWQKARVDYFFPLQTY